MTATIALLADLPPILEDVLFHLLQAHSDLKVIRGSALGAGLAAAAAAVGASLVVVTRPEPAVLKVVDQTLAQAASVAVFALNGDGSRGCMHILRLESTRYDDLSGTQLAATLTAAAPPDRR